MNLLSDNQRISNSHSKIRAGRVVLIFLGYALYDGVFNAPAALAAPPLV